MKAVRLPLLCLCVFGACSTISNYDQAAYANATSLKVDTINLVGKATESYSAHTREISELTVKLDKAYEYDNGDFGTNSQKALHEFEQASIDLGNSAAGSFDGRSEGNIQTLLPAAQRKAREFMKAVRDAGITIKIISGTRTFAEQHALFTQVPHVTKADAGHSNHNFGVAWDIGDFTGGTYHPESEVYKKVGEIGKKLGLEWGGDWHGFKDEPHFQAVPETELKNIAAKFESGTAFV